MDDLDFSTKLIEEMIDKYHESANRKKTGYPKLPGPKLMERHFPDLFPSTEIVQSIAL